MLVRDCTLGDNWGGNGRGQLRKVRRNKMADYIPRTDATFDTWQINYVTYFAANAVALGFDPLVEGLALGLTQTAWANGYAGHTTAQADAKAATGVKDSGRNALIALIRGYSAQMQVNPAVTDLQKSSLGITIPDTIPTPVGVPTSRPVLEVDTSQRLQITVSFRDEFATSTAKPDGVRGCEIWTKVDGAAPLDISETMYQATDTRSPHLLSFDGADGGKTVHIIGRWVNTKGEVGPISETVSATIPG